MIQTPGAQGQPGVLFRRGRSEGLTLPGRLHQTSKSEQRVDHKDARLLQGPHEPGLEDIVHQTARIADVVKGVADPLPDRFGQDRLIALSDRLEEVKVELVVDLEKKPVHGFQGIGDRLLFLDRVVVAELVKEILAHGLILLGHQNRLAFRTGFEVSGPGFTSCNGAGTADSQDKDQQQDRQHIPWAQLHTHLTFMTRNPQRCL